MQSSTTVKFFGKRKSCYFCGAPGPSTREHAPIKQLFEAFDCSSITVPACDKHNSDRNRIDRALLTFLLRGLEHRFRTASLTGNQLWAYDKAKHKLKYAPEVTTLPLVEDPLEVLDTPAPHIADTSMVESYMRQLTAAMAWAVVGDYDPLVDWDDAVVWGRAYLDSDHSLSIPDAARRLRRQEERQSIMIGQAIHWWPGWSAYPKPYPSDVYRLEVSLVPIQLLEASANGREVIFRHWFFGEYPWCVRFIASRKMYTAVAGAVRTIKG